MIKSICLDLDGVYFTEAGFKGFKKELEALGATPENIVENMHGDLMNSFKRGELAEAELLETIRANTTKQVIPINAKSVCLFGGSVRCTTLQLGGKNGDILNKIK